MSLTSKTSRLPGGGTPGRQGSTVAGHADRAQEPAWPKRDCKPRANADVHRFLPIGVHKGEGAALPDESSQSAGKG